MKPPMKPAMKRSKPWTRMTEAELAAATREFDKGVPLEETLPLSAADRARWERMRANKPPRSGTGRGAGRPKVGAGSKPVLITVEAGLLREIDAYAEGHDLSRSQLLAEGVRRMLRGKTGRKTA
jgi:hypothetical protein